MKKPRIHKMPDGGEMTNAELCKRYGIPIHRTCGLTTRQILNYHNRKKKKAFSLQGKTATLAEWGKALNISPTIFRDTVYSCERAGGTREDAMLATVRHLAGDRKPGGAIKHLSKIKELRAEKKELA